jgi:hypothetical protein
VPTNAVLDLRMDCVRPLSRARTAGYSISGIAVDRKHALERLPLDRGPWERLSLLNRDLFCTRHLARAPNGSILPAEQVSREHPRARS